MDIIVIGAGAIGSVYGARLSISHDVTLIARPAHVDAIARRGLRIIGAEDRTYHLRAATHLDAIPRNAFVLVTTKVADTEAAVRPIVPLVDATTTIISLQNGLYSDAPIKALIGDRGVVLRGITQFGAIFQDPGVVELKVVGHTLLERHERTRELADVLTVAGLDGRVSENIKAEMWRKLIYNCVINPITSIIGTDVGGIADQRLDPLKRLVIDECLAVARADGITFDIDFVETIDATFGPSRNIASMRQDLLKGRRTEIAYLNGAVAVLGSTYGIDCPVNVALARIIEAMEQSGRERRK